MLLVIGHRSLVDEIQHLQGPECNVISYDTTGSLAQACTELARSFSPMSAVQPVKLLWLHKSEDEGEGQGAVLIPILTLMQVLQRRSLCFNVCSNVSLIERLFPDNHNGHVMATAAERRWYLGAQVFSLTPPARWPVLLKTYIRGVDFLERTLLASHVSEDASIVLSSHDDDNNIIKEGIYQAGRAEDYFAVHTHGRSLYLTRLPEDIDPHRQNSHHNQPHHSSHHGDCVEKSPADLDKGELLLENKLRLKKLIMLSLRRAGLKCPSNSSKKDADAANFKLTYKQLYCGCLLALRKELPVHRLTNDVLLAVINNNLKAIGL